MPTFLCALCIAIILCSVILLVASTVIVYLASNFLSIHAMDSLHFLSWLYKVRCIKIVS